MKIDYYKMCILANGVFVIGACALFVATYHMCKKAMNKMLEIAKIELETIQEFGDILLSDNVEESDDE